jgi:hypothetical protein
VGVIFLQREERELYTLLPTEERVSRKDDDALSACYYFFIALLLLLVLKRLLRHIWKERDDHQNDFGLTTKKIDIFF